MAYARCFGTGKRAALTERVFDGIQGRDCTAVEAHRLYKDLRDKHVAHSVNPFEQVKIGLVLSPSSREPTVEGVARISMNLLTLEREGIESLKECASIARRHVEQKCNALQDEVLRAGQRLPVEQLYKKTGLGMFAPRPTDAGKPRSR